MVPNEHPFRKVDLIFIKKFEKLITNKRIYTFYRLICEVYQLLILVRQFIILKILMKKALMVFLCLTSLVAYSTDYYVSSSGNDSANGISSSTPWQSIAKVNSVFSGLNPGDRILFKRGDRFSGTLQVSRSGLSGNPITISAYGSGANPVISGFTTITGWNSYGGGIYSRAITCQSKPNMVTVNDVNTPIGRWPNTGFLTVDSHISNTSITDADLPGSPLWTGAEVVIRKAPYIWDRNIITGHSGGTLYYQSNSSYSARDGYGYFIQNDIRTLDQTGEWYYNGSTFYMYFGAASPDNYQVKVSTYDQLVYMDGFNYITIENISFEGANLYAVQIKNSDYITVQNCNIAFTGGTAIFGPWWGTSPYCKVINNTINESNNGAIELNGDHTYATIQNNTISNTGLIVGMGENADGTYMALAAHGDNSIIQYNTIRNTGYVGINFTGNNSVISHNLVDKFNVVKNDGGGIYTFVGTGTAKSGQKVTNNIVINGVGFGDGLPDKAFNAHGIYMDDRTRNVVVTDNTVANCNSSGIYLHNAHEIEVSRNTLFNNGDGNDNYGSQILFIHDSYSPNDPIRNVTMNNNIFFAKMPAQKVLAFSTSSNDIASFGTADYNCYAKPVDNAYVVKTWESGWNSVSTNRSLSNWQTYSGKDRNSYISPVAVNDVNKIKFEFNGSNSSKVISLDGSYIDVKGTKYSGSITLLPYASAVLMVDPNPSAPPSIPVFVSSAVENSAPSVIEVIYNMNLANTTPAASAFSVQVNSVARSINSVSVSGTKVLLTLASPVAYGNTVTVGYTAPSINPLQTPAGGIAASLSAQTVTNRVNAPPPPPPVPEYTGSAIENATPSVLELTYNLTLASMVPPASAFSVQVNSVARAVSSVSVSGTKVLLTMASPVVYGNIVTVAYTKPSTNPLQTLAGGQAASMSAQAVSNKVIAVTTPPPVVVTPPPVVVTPTPVPNTPPVVVVNYQNTTYSGFEAVLNASGSYDTNNDQLTFTWTAPNNIPVSSLSGPIIKFLGPIVDVSQKVEFTLKVSDGKTVQSKLIQVDILPYQPELKAAQVVKIEASGFQTPYYPHNIIDGDIGTMWSANGNDQWIILELKEPFNIQHIKLAFQSGLNKEAYFDILGSEDKENWELILTKSNSCAFSGNMQVFDFPPSKTGKEFRYVKMVGLGNAVDLWNYISEFRIFGYPHNSPSDYDEQVVKIYPNPALGSTTISIEEQTFVPDFIKVLSLSGKIMYHEKLDPDIRQFQLPLNFRQGLYVVQIGSGTITMFTQKIVVLN